MAVKLFIGSAVWQANDRVQLEGGFDPVADNNLNRRSDFDATTFADDGRS